MEVGERSNGGRWRQKRQRRASVGISYERSVENLSRGGRETLEMVNQNRPKPLNTIPGTSSVVFDNTSRQYDWLCSGWLVEERRMLSNRLYRYYYDPVGQTYNTRQEVETICQDIERNHVVIILDD